MHEVFVFLYVLVSLLLCIYDLTLIPYKPYRFIYDAETCSVRSQLKLIIVHGVVVAGVKTFRS